MNYTKNHHLPQWVSSDRIRMDDFNDAMANIEAGLDAANKKADAVSAVVKSYAIGSYVGASKLQLVSVGFTPSFIIISGTRQSADQNLVPFTVLTAGTNDLADRIMLTDGGFLVYPEGYNNVSYPALNRTGVTYDYIAFR